MSSQTTQSQAKVIPPPSWKRPRLTPPPPPPPPGVPPTRPQHPLPTKVKGSSSDSYINDAAVQETLHFTLSHTQRPPTGTTTAVPLATICTATPTPKLTPHTITLTAFEAAATIVALDKTATLEAAINAAMADKVAALQTAATAAAA
ncbi:MAG: hypothetical protein NZ807_06660, partial [Dehalococcoidia bacterium]|nr:hypothetical protein [Dehalococcoidia bacterium]